MNLLSAALAPFRVDTSELRENLRVKGYNLQKPENSCDS